MASESVTFHFRCPRCNARRFATLARLRLTPVVRCASCKFEWEFSVEIVEAGHAYASQALREMRATIDEALFQRLMSPRDNGVWPAEPESDEPPVDAEPVRNDPVGKRRSVKLRC